MGKLLASEQGIRAQRPRPPAQPRAAGKPGRVGVGGGELARGDPAGEALTALEDSSKVTGHNDLPLRVFD